jgi:hypothetical protein
MATTRLPQRVIDLSEQDEFDALSLALESASALDLVNDAIRHLQGTAATSPPDPTAHRLQDAMQSPGHSRMLLSAVLGDLHQAAAAPDHLQRDSQESAE